ncbi:MAG: oligoendopeptidase F [Ignavibacteriales bacterium]
MIKHKMVVLVMIFLATAISSAQQIERKDVPEKYKWNLADTFKDLDAWKNAYQSFSQRIGDISKYKGKLGDSADNLFYTIDTYFKMLKEIYLISDYASRLSDEDLRISENQALTQQASTLWTNFAEASSFFSPEILRIEPEKIQKFYKQKPELKNYERIIFDIQRLRNHTLSENEEKILASFGLVAETPSNVYGIFNNAEMPNEKVVLSTGEEVELSSSGFVKYRTIENREDRKKIFDAFFNNYGKFKNTIGVNLAGKVKSDFTYAKNRNYATSLEASLNNYAIPPKVYETLISQINENLPTLHRFLSLKKKMLGLDELHYYDLYTPIVKSVDMKFSIEQGQDVILKALKPMGEEYVNTVKKSFNDRWIDYIPNVGKRSGAYSSGAAYDYHPYILTNWTDDYESVSTLAHELGHTMHSYFSNKNQPFQYSDYSTFVAEIASTCNENLLNNYMINNVKTKEEKIFLLGSYLELLRTTIFRQVSFAEFEWEIHKKVEAGEPLNGEVLSNIYYEIVKKYYGHDKGVCIVDPYIQYEWAYIPHFINYSYYVYQYSTSLIYATAFAEKIIKDGKPAVDAYYNILKGGSSDYPIELIKKAGIDPLSSEAFDLTMKKMNSVMDQIEELMK